jgi:hypothetical protein
MYKLAIGEFAMVAALIKSYLRVPFQTVHYQ